MLRQRTASNSRKLPAFFSLLGAGLITGASDDDPSGIATYSQAGAQFGYQLAWTMLFTYPLMVVIQDISARIGRVTGEGIAGNLRQHYPKWLLQGIVLLLLMANTLNIGADLGAMAEATKLLLPHISAWVWVVLFGALCTFAAVFLSHERYVSVLKWLTLSLLSYVAILGVINVPWAEVVRSVVLPRWSPHSGFWLMVVAILGTTISPYLFFWQAGQEVEDTKAHAQRVPLKQAPAQAPSALKRIRLDTLIGMGYSNLVGLAIVISTGATLQRAGIRQIDTASQAAQALRPLAGDFAFALFALGIVGTGLLSVPVLAGSAAYALGEARRWPVGLSRKPLRAKAFYGTIAAATLLGAALNIADVSAMKALVWAAVLNGIVAAPVMALLVLMGMSPKLMGSFTISRRALYLGWLATAVMVVATAGWAISALGSS